MLLLLILSPSQPPTTPSIAPMPYMPSAAPIDHRESERGVGVARVERRVRKERESDKAK